MNSNILFIYYFHLLIKQQQPNQNV